MSGVSLSNISKAEWKIIYILKEEKIEFEREKTFKDLRLGLLRYDFFIPSKKIIIEFNGAQHYQWVTHFFRTRQDFLAQQERDRRKISYALAHGYKMYCIPYWEEENIGCFKDLIKPEFRVKSKFHNDIAWRNFSKKG